jgi:hypothetical protein
MRNLDLHKKPKLLLAEAHKIAVVFALCFIATSQSAFTYSATLVQPKKPIFCVTPSYRQWDFWVGDWDVFDISNLTTKVARVRVESILNGCVLRENYEDTDGYHGQSLSIFDASRQLWHQSWMTDRGQLLMIEGGMQAGAMVLSGVDHTPDGKKRIVRGIWKPVQGGVRETATRSTDDGLNWTPWFDLMFRPHQP